MAILWFLLTLLCTLPLQNGYIATGLSLPIPVDRASAETLVPPTLTIDMPIDHFNACDSRTYKNRYWVNDTYYQQGGPVFFYDRGEATVGQRQVISVVGHNGTLSAPLRLAERFGGMVVLWEHRFYGNSHPFALNNKTGAALAGYEAYRYLNNEQALEDAVHLANNFRPPGYQNNTFLSPSQTPWIWIGGSYPGVRAAMIRLRNPEIFYAAWASSAPVEAQVDMSVYYKPIQQSMPLNCSADVHAAIMYVDGILLDGTPAQAATVQLAILLAFAANSNLTSLTAATPHIDSFDYYSMANNLSYVFELSNTAFQYVGYAASLGRFCDRLEGWNPANWTDFDLNTTGIEWLKNPADLRFTSGGVAASFGNEQAFYAFLSATIHEVWEDKAQDSKSNSSANTTTSLQDTTSWTWQFCSEFGFFQDSNTSDPMNLVSKFSNVSSYAQNECKDVFSFAPNRPEVKAILKYGGYKMTPSNTMFTNGELDPWRTLGVQADTKINPSAIVRESTVKVPPCNVPPLENQVFGLVYAGKGHASDLSKSAAQAKSGETTSADLGFELFGEALEKWLVCF